MDQKNAKIAKRSYASKVYESTYNVEILCNLWNCKIQLKDAECTTKHKPTYLLSESRGFKFVTKLVLQFKTESDDETKYSIFYLKTKAETIINDVFE